jgi:heme exporter protein B
MIRHIVVLVRSELRNEGRAGEVATVMIPFGAVALLVIPMAVGIDASLLSRIGPGLFWSVVLLFGIVVTQRQSGNAERPQRDLLALLGVDPAARFAATAIASTVLLIAFEVAAGWVTIFLYDPEIVGWGWLVLVLLLVAAGLGMVGTIAGSITGGVGGRGALTPLLVAPIAIPILLGGAQATEGLRVGVGILRWVLVLAVVDVLLALAGVLTARPLEESS